MLHALYPPPVDGFFMAPELVELCEQGEDLPLPTFLGEFDEAGAGADGRLQGDEELNAGHLAGNIYRAQRWRPDGGAVVDGNLLEPEAIP